jgi:streptogramin lyase
LFGSLAILLALSLLAACGGDDDDTNTPAAASTTAATATSAASTATTATLTTTETQSAATATSTSEQAATATGAATSVVGTATTPPVIGTISDVIEIGGTLGPFAYGASALWVVNTADSTLVRVDATTSQVVTTFQMGADPPDTLELGVTLSVAASDEAVWVYRYNAGPPVRSEVQRIDPTTNTIVATVPLPEAIGVGSLVIDADGDLWASSMLGNLMIRIDGESNAVASTIDLPLANHTAFGEGTVWVVAQKPDRSPGTVVRIDPTTDSIVAEIATNGVSRVAVGDGQVWISNPFNNEVARIDPATNEIVDVLPIEFTVPIVITGDSVWTVTYAAAPTLLRIDPNSLAVVETYSLGAFPGELLAAGGAVWAVDFNDGTISRIDI